MAPDAIVTAVAANTDWKKKSVDKRQPTLFRDPERVSAREEEHAVADEVAIPAVGEGEAACEEREDTDDRIGHVLGEDVDDVLRTGEARFDEREARLHEEDQHAGHEHPDVVQDVLGRRFVGLGEADGRGDGQDGDHPSQA